MRVLAKAEGKFLQREGRDLAKVVWGWVGELLTPYIDAERETRWFGKQHNIDQFEWLEHITRVGVPVDVDHGCNIKCELA